MKDESVDIRAIQHYLYCKHRWGLIYLACDWSENVYILKALLMHERADGGKNSFLRGKYVERSVKVYNDDWNLFGVLDCLQLTPHKNGCYIEKYKDFFNLEIIEYKPTAPKGDCRIEDKMQLLAQKICVDYVFKTSSSAIIYYGDTRKRQKVEFYENDFLQLKKIIQEISYQEALHVIPPIAENQNCNGCSMKDICMPIQ